MPDLLLLRPLFWLALPFACGIAAARMHWLSGVCLLVLSGISLSGVVLWRKKQGILLALLFVTAVFSLGGAIFNARSFKPANDIQHLLAQMKEGELVVLKGQVIGDISRRGKRSMFTLEVNEAEFGNRRYFVCGRARIICLFPLVAQRGLLLKAKYDLEKDSFVVSSVLDVRGLTSQGHRPEDLVARLRMKILGALNQWHASVSTAGVITAMVLGEKKYIPLLVKRSMLRTGTLHLLVVSGFNTGLVAFFVMFLLKTLRLARQARRFIAVLTVIIYCLLTGSSAPVFRATVMTVLFLMAYFFRREGDLYNLLGCAAIVLLCFNPYFLFDLGFQLSFLSVLSIVVFYPLLRKWTRTGEVKPAVLRWAADGALVSLSAWLGTLPVTVGCFRMFSSVTVFANLLAVPLTSLITVCGFCQIVCFWLFPELGRYFAGVSDLLIAALVYSIGFFERIPGAWVKF